MVLGHIVYGHPRFHGFQGIVSPEVYPPCPPVFLDRPTCTCGPISSSLVPSSLSFCTSSECNRTASCLYPPNTLQYCYTGKAQYSTVGEVH